MAICSNCHSEGPRVRCKWDEQGHKLLDECPQCSPGSFEKFTAPSDKKIWMGYEAHPNEYVHSEDGGFDRKPEYRAEQEQRLREPTEEEKEAQRRAIDHKRATRRTRPMDREEVAAAIRKAEKIVDFMSDGVDRN